MKTKSPVKALLMCITIVALAFGLVMCESKAAAQSNTATTAKPESPATAKLGSAESGSGHPWDYSTEPNGNGPANWHNWYPDCGGNSQSPIDLGNVPRGTMGYVEARYFPVFPTVKNTGHSIEVETPKGGSVEFGSGSNLPTYNLAQFHFHSPSEHTIDGQHFTLEVHLVHKLSTDADKLLVIGVMFQEGDSNPAVSAALDQLLAVQGRDWFDPVDIIKLLPSGTPQQKFYQYSGSLTTPPCTEGVQWIVAEQPITATKGQIDKLKSYYANNARPVQPVNGRSVVKHCQQGTTPCP
jgi:carbonic anhydrase